MNGRRYTEEEDTYIRENFGKMTAESIGGHLGRSKFSVLHRLNILNLKKKSVRWKGEILERLRRLYPDHYNEDLAVIFGCSKKSIAAAAFMHGLRKSKEHMAALENSGRFKKGHAPANKGKNMSPEVYAKVVKTTFKKGHLPHNTKHDGVESIRTDKRGVPYIFVRVAQGVWVHKQRLEWEKLHGPIPKGMVLRSKDGDTLNCDPDNWMLMTKAEHVDITRYTDRVIAKRMAFRNPELERELLRNPDIIELKRQTMKLKRAIDGRLNDEGCPAEAGGHEEQGVPVQE